MRRGRPGDLARTLRRSKGERAQAAGVPLLPPPESAQGRHRLRSGMAPAREPSWVTSVWTFPRAPESALAESWERLAPKDGAEVTAVASAGRGESGGSAGSERAVECRAATGSHCRPGERSPTLSDPAKRVLHVRRGLDIPYLGAPKGIRIPVAALKGLCPRPLDDGGTPRPVYYHNRSLLASPPP